MPREICKKLFSLTKWAGALKDWGGPHEGEQPTTFIAVLMPADAGQLVCFDVGIAAQTMQLAACSRGCGCCMIQSFDHSAASTLLHVPTGMKIALLIGFGVAKETRVVVPMPADRRLRLLARRPRRALCAQTRSERTGGRAVLTLVCMRSSYEAGHWWLFLHYQPDDGNDMHMINMLIFLLKEK